MIIQNKEQYEELLNLKESLTNAQEKLNILNSQIENSISQWHDFINKDKEKMSQIDKINNLDIPDYAKEMYTIFAKKDIYDCYKYLDISDIIKLSPYSNIKTKLILDKCVIFGYIAKLGRDGRNRIRYYRTYAWKHENTKTFEHIYNHLPKRLQPIYKYLKEEYYYQQEENKKYNVPEEQIYGETAGARVVICIEDAVPDLDELTITNYCDYLLDLGCVDRWNVCCGDKYSDDNWNEKGWSYKPLD